MGLKATAGNGTAAGYANNTLYVNKARVARFVDHGPGTPQSKLPEVKRYAKFDKNSDLICELVLDIGKEFQPSIFFIGLLAKEDNGSIKGTGVAGDLVKLARAVNYIGEDILDADNRLTTAFIEAVADAKIQYLRYFTGTSPEGKAWYDNWTRIFSVDETGDDIANEFMLGWNKYEWPRNYQGPNSRGPAPQTSQEKTVADKFKKDQDDLPW